MKPFGRKLLWAARGSLPALTPEDVASRLAPRGCGVTPTSKRPAVFVASHGELVDELNDAQRATFNNLEAHHDEAYVDRVLSVCGTAWVVTTDHDNGSRHIVHHVLQRDGIVF